MHWSDSKLDQLLLSRLDSLIPRLLPDVISQLWRKLGQFFSTAVSGSGLGTRLILVLYMHYTCIVSLFTHSISICIHCNLLQRVGNNMHTYNKQHLVPLMSESKLTDAVSLCLAINTQNLYFASPRSEVTMFVHVKAIIVCKQWSCVSCWYSRSWISNSSYLMMTHYNLRFYEEDSHNAGQQRLCRNLVWVM